MKDMPCAIHSTQREKSKKTRPSPLRRRRIIAVLLGGLAVISMLALWIDWNLVLSEGAVHLIRDEQGRLARQHEQASSGMKGQLHAGRIRAQNNLRTTSVESRTERARFACRRLMVFNRSEHLLMQRVGTGLLDHLKQLRGFEYVAYYPAGERPEPGELAPDVAVTLELSDLDQTTAVSRRLGAKIRMTGSTMLQRSRHNYYDPLNLPRLDAEFTTSLNHRSITTAIGSPSSRFKLAAEDIAKQLGAALVKKLNGLYTKRGPMPDLPDAFYPEYRPPPQLVWPPGVSAAMIASCRGPMTVNETLWRLDAQSDPREWITILQQDLEADGWKTNSITTRKDRAPYLRVSGQAGVLTVYRELLRGDLMQTHNPAARPLHAHYVQRMDHQQLAEAVNVLLDQDAPLETVLYFERQLQAHHRERLLQRLLDRAPKSPDGWLLLAQMHRAADRKQASSDALARADVLLRTVVRQGLPQRRIKSLAKKWDAEEVLNQPPRPDLLQELGFVELTLRDSVYRQDLRFNEPALFFHRSDDGDLRTIAIRILPDGRGGYELSHISAKQRSRWWARGGTSENIGLGGLRYVTVAGLQLDDPTRFRLEARVK